MFEKEIKFNDGTRIFCEKENGSMQRFIEYGFSPFEKEQIKKDPRLKTYLKKRVRKYNAGKYYYLGVLYTIVCGLNEKQRQQLYNELKALHDKVEQEYNPNIRSKEFLATFGKYWEYNSSQCAAFFMTIYLAMLDYEEGKRFYPHSLGKTMVLKSCEAVILKNVDPKDAAVMFERKGYAIYDDMPKTKPIPSKHVAILFNTTDSNSKIIANAVMEHLANTSDDIGSISVSVGRHVVEETLFHNAEYLDGINKYLQNCKATQVKFDSSDLNCVVINYERNLKELLAHYQSMAIVSDDDLREAITDDKGVSYSKNGKRLLKGVKSLDYAVKEGTEVICNDAFEFENVKNIQFPKSLKYIGNRAFGYCRNFVLPNGLLGVGEEAFFLSGFNDVLVIPNSVIYIGKYAFAGSITERLVIGNGLKRIEECTFRDIGAESIEIGDSVSYLGNLAFGDYLGEVVIPPSVKNIEGNPFGGKVKQIVSLSEAFVIRDNILYSKDGKEIITCISQEKELMIPNTVKYIHPYAFTSSEVESIILPDSVTGIGEGAFYMAKTKNVHLPNGIKKIPLMAFYKSMIETILIPDSVTKIEIDAFKVCKNLKEVQMSHNIETIGETAFAFCMKLEHLELSKSLKNIGDKAFFCCHELKKHEDEIGRSININ